MRAVSKKRAALNRARRKLIASMGEPMCRRCGKRAEDLHEPGKRSQGADPSDPSQVVPVCRACHDHIHANVAESVRDGWLLSRKEIWP